MEAVCGERVRIFGVGRTDESVHARKYVAHFTTKAQQNLRKLPLAMCAHLPEDISVLAAEAAPEGFDARYSARSKTYVYRMYVSPTRRPLLDSNHLQLYKTPDLAIMRAGASILQGEHDFMAFSKSGSSIKGSVRTLFAVEVLDKQTADGQIIEIWLSGNAFLYNMARLCAGALVAAGQGRITLADIQNSLAAARRTVHFKTLSPHALTLENIEY